jgi:hypothetical protein
MKVYRLEHKESRIGFFWHKYKGNSDYYWSEVGTRIYERCNVLATHPNTAEDLGAKKASIAIDNNWVHGCYTLDQFFAWFEIDWYELIKYGFGLFEYELEDKNEFFIGKSQVVFNPRVAINRREVSIKEYEEAIK